MNVMDRLFPGRKVRAPDTIAAALSTARDAMSDAQARVASAADRRKAAIASGDRSAAITAESERAAAEIYAEIAVNEVAGLERGLANAIEAERAAARAALVASLVERRGALANRFAEEWRDAATVMAALLSAAGELARDVKEAGAEREVERLPSVPRGLVLNGEALADFSNFLGDALSGLPAVSESPKEASFREAEESRARRKAEEAEARRIKAEAEREKGRIAREAEDAKARERVRDPYYPSRQAMSDAAR